MYDFNLIFASVFCWLRVLFCNNFESICECLADYKLIIMDELLGFRLKFILILILLFIVMVTWCDNEDVCDYVIVVVLRIDKLGL